jgi:hypothetical protein
MAFREFTDRRGVIWTVWDVRPGTTHLLLVAADHPLEYYHTGWLSFQTQLGTDQRVLSPIPPGWETFSETSLLDLLNRASPVRSGRQIQRELSAAASTPARPTAVREVQRSPVVRAFVHPSGRAWTVAVTSPEHGGSPVLRFTSGGRSVDLQHWPVNWTNLSDESLVVLLRGVQRTSPPPGAGTPRRRWNDPRP